MKWCRGASLCNLSAIEDPPQSTYGGTVTGFHSQNAGSLGSQMSLTTFLALFRGHYLQAITLSVK